MQRPPRDLPRHVPPAVLLALALVFFGPTWLGRIHLETDAYGWFYPWRAQRVGSDSGACVPLANSELLDPLLIYAPQDRLLNASLKQGTLPLWDPYSFCGHPFQAVGHPSMTYPPRLLLHGLLPPLAAREASLFLHMLACGMAMYLCLRGLRLSRLASLLGGMTWMLGGYPLTYLEFEYVEIVGAHVPLIFWLVDRVIAEGSARWVAALALAMGSLLLAGHWQYVTYGMIACGAWMAYRTVTHARGGGGWQALRLLVLASMGALLIGAVQVWPSLQLILDSPRPSTSLDQMFNGARFLPENLLTLWLSDALGHPGHDFFLTPIRSGVQNYRELCGYVGFVPLVLGLLALYRPRGPIIFFSVMALLGLLYAMGNPLATWLYYVLPGFKTFTPVRTIFFYALSLPVLAAFGLQRVLDGEVGVGAIRLALVWWAASVAGLAWFSAQVQDTAFVENLALRYPSVLEMPNYCADKHGWVRHVLAAMRDHYSLMQPTLGIPLLLALVGLLALHHGIRHGLRTALLLGVVAADLLYFGFRFDVTFPAATALPPAPALKFLTEHGQDAVGDPYRMACLIRPVHPDLPTAWSLQDVAGYGSLSPDRTWRLITRASGEEQTRLMADLGSGATFTAGLATLMGVRWLCTDPPHPLPNGRLVHHGDLNVYDLGDHPRFFLVSKFRVEPDADKVLTAVLAPDFRPQDEVWLETPPDHVPPGSAPAGQVRNIRYGLNHIELDVQSAQNALLVSGDSWWPGWEALVDGTATPVRRADYAFRAVSVPAGAHHVAMDYRPRPFFLGLGLSLLSVAACLVPVLKRS
ncbi:MAG TPA: YfhO family protein [Candidatus Xenobia bacterium]